MHLGKKRATVTLAAALIAAVIGGTTGYMLGRFIVLRVAKSRLVDQAARSLTAADAYSADVRKALAAMNSSRYPYCSDKELTFFRQILIGSRYLREGGRMTDGRIDCSTTLGREGLPQERFKPFFSGADDFHVYWDLAPFRVAGEASSVMQSGASFVTMASHMRSENLPPGASLSMTLRGLGWQSMSPQVDKSGTSFREDGFRRAGPILSATSCSTRYIHCVTVAISVTDAFRLGRPMFIVCAGLMAFVGGALGLLLTLAYYRNRTMEQRLRKAIRKDELQMVYQPVVDLTTRNLVGAEALARWTDEDGTAVAPDRFIPLAEEHGFVSEITRLALRHVLRDLGELLRSDSSFQVSVNVTAGDLSDASFVPMLEKMLAESGVRAESMTIEITETSTARYERAIETIRLLRAAGHRVHIDDFGTGYSSLAYLQDLSVDAIKIDKIFTHAIGTDSAAVSVLPQILAMAEALNLEIVAEGVETERQACYFASSDRRMRAQGWLFGRPMPARMFLAEMTVEEKQTPALPAYSTVLQESEN